ncbi:hypothetical protein QFC22_004776 [Naganishia vaughanmartiniae]|uniref:Uncharacterized protein n=1 Tax=Naganishia vaughanmartiniae TaxID=1424756 RepID=A0ACC2WZV5_9TREE|nr:hypothetical protein QFC22_004776 [Naganishia vaughanmartiniae]
MSPFTVDKVMNDIQQTLDAIHLTAAKKKTKKARQKANRNKPSALLTLPAELLEIIASMVHQQSPKSLANFNLCSKTLYTLSLPMLRKEVVWKMNTWKNVQGRCNGYPPGWQFVESPWFWKGLFDTLPAEEVYLGSDDIVRARFPELKAVVRTEASKNVEVPKAVWLTIPYANSRQSTTTASPVAKIIGMAYRAWHIASSASAFVPRFVALYEAVDRGFIEAYISGKPWRKNMKQQGPDIRRFTPTTLRDFAFNADATLEVDTIFSKRSLDFHILSDFRQQDQVGRLLRGHRIWQLFHLVQHHFETSKLTFVVEGGFIFPEVGVWLQTVCIGSRSQKHFSSYENQDPNDLHLERQARLAAENESGETQVEVRPFVLEAILQVPLDTDGFVAESLELQQVLLRKVQQHGAISDGTTIPAYFPVKIEISDLGDPSLPPPSCKHVEIDFESAETRRVVLISECFPGGCDHKGYRDGQLMPPAEQNRWKDRMRAT